jgi:hypothetical protein
MAVTLAFGSRNARAHYRGCTRWDGDGRQLQAAAYGGEASQQQRVSGDCGGIATAVKRPQRIIGDLLTAEISDKQARSIKYQLTIAKRPLAKDLDDFQFEARRSTESGSPSTPCSC